MSRAPFREVRWSNRALRDMRRFPTSLREPILDTVERYAVTGHGDAQQLRGQAGQWRLRIGDYRVIFTIEQDGDVMLILRVHPRGRAYRS